MSLIINNSIYKANVTINGGQIQVIDPKERLEVVPKSGMVVLRLFSNYQSTFSMLNSDFWLITTYRFENGLPDELYIQYQEAKPSLKVNHIYKRLCFSNGEATLPAENQIIPERRRLSEHILGVAVNLPLSIVFYGIGILLCSLILGFCFKSIAVGIGTAVALVLGFSIYAVLEEVIFNRFFDHLKKKNLFLKKADLPLYYETCSDNDYIETCFQFLD